MDIILGKDSGTLLRIEPAKTVFWTGAGISCLPPASLPLGNGLTDAYLKNCLGPKWQDFVILWNNNFPQIMNSVQYGIWKKPDPIGTFTIDTIDQAGNRPRLEYVVGEMTKMDRYFNNIRFNNPENNKRFHRGSTLSALREFAKIEPCLYHYRLADLARAGAVVVTANYDDGIEKALNVESNSPETSYGTRAVSNGCGGYIYHFHGIATDPPESLGATINSVSKGLHEEFQRYIKSLFEKGYNIVFIGYGGVDFFDVKPFFESLESKKYTGKAIYLQYCTSVTKAEELRNTQKGYEYLLTPFQQQYIVYGNPIDAFDEFFDSYTPVSLSSVDCKAFRATTDVLEGIVRAQKDEETYHFLNMFRLCSQLNINPGRFYPDWVDKIVELVDVWEKDGSIERMTVVDGQKNDGIIDDIYSNNWHDERIKKTGIEKKLAPYIKKWNKKHKNLMMKVNRKMVAYGFWLPKSIVKKYVDETDRILADHRTDEYSNDINRSTVMYLCGGQTKIAVALYRYSGGLLKKRMMFTKECIDRLIKHPFTRFVYRTHYLSLCRQSAYIDAALHKGKNGYEGDIQAEWNICMQTPNLYDAGQVLQARLIQAKRHGITKGVDELREIRGRILDLRKQESELI